MKYWDERGKLTSKIWISVYALNFFCINRDTYKFWSKLKEYNQSNLISSWPQNVNLKWQQYHIQPSHLQFIVSHICSGNRLAYMTWILLRKMKTYILAPVFWYFSLNIFQDIKVIPKLGGTVEDTELIEGLVFTQKAANINGPKRVEKAKIGLIQFCISPPKTDVSTQHHLELVHLILKWWENIVVVNDTCLQPKWGKDLQWQWSLHF